jgi:sugar phosphate isomerase/epimerase
VSGSPGWSSEELDSIWIRLQRAREDVEPVEISIAHVLDVEVIITMPGKIASDRITDEHALQKLLQNRAVTDWPIFMYAKLR